MNPILLSPFDISIAASLIILDAALSMLLKLRLHRQIAIAAARMVVQLVAIGYVLRFIFTLNNPAATLLLILVMVLVAARNAGSRTIQISSSGLSASALPHLSRRSLR
jgi:putative ABC transport system permease protein